MLCTNAQYKNITNSAYSHYTSNLIMLILRTRRILFCVFSVYIEFISCLRQRCPNKPKYLELNFYSQQLCKGHYSSKFGLWVTYWTRNQSEIRNFCCTSLIKKIVSLYSDEMLNELQIWISGWISFIFKTDSGYKSGDHVGYFW